MERLSNQQSRPLGRLATLKVAAVFERDLVFIGGGHSHALVLRMLAMKPLTGVRLTLVTDTLLTPYSGMLPGYMAGHYSLDDTHIDLNKLCRAAGVRLIHDRVIGLDAQHKTIRLANHGDLRYDRVSINTGSTPNLTIPGAAEFAVGVKPVSQLTAMWQRLLEADYKGKTPHWAVVGAGAAGVEVILAIAHRFARLQKPIRLSLVYSSADILPNYTPRIRRVVSDALAKAGVERVANFSVAEVRKDRLISANNLELHLDKSIWCTPATAPHWPQDAGLDVDHNGFITVNQYLQSTSHSDVFAVGDVSAMTLTPRPKAGVFAVRSAPFLRHNLTAAFTDQHMRPVRLQKDFLSLLALGDQRAVGMRNGFSFAGRWVWRWKDRIDRQFMALFSTALPQMQASDSMSDNTMHCAGCGSKLGPELLSETLAELHQGKHHQAEDAALAFNSGGHQLWQSIDGFRSFTDDLYRLGQVVTHHAVNDSYAMGIAPSSAQVWANLAFSHPRIARRDFRLLMSGIQSALAEHDTELIGGHSTEGLETHVALVVNGEGTAQWHKSNIQAGDWLLLNKPIGSGILLAADMQGKAHALAIEALWAQLLRSNRAFFQQLQTHTVHAATDVTGFGLIGHLLEMTDGSGCSIALDADAVPLMRDALTLSEQGVHSTLLPQLTPLLLRCKVECENTALVNCLLDPQTQGGLLISVPPATAEALLAQGDVWKIGEVTEANSKPITVR
nr:selenide, water dikinase SelD [Reinekea sp. G2M2-21]